MKKEFIILSIEDSIPDFTLLKKALKEIPDLTLQIINIDNGEDALKFIYKKGKYQKSLTPHLIILDINLPTIGGKEVLKQLKSDKTYKNIPIIILSSSESEKEIKEAYNLSANSYITKPFEVDKLFKKIANLGEYWLKTSELPSNNIIIE